jgi:hypothetical protein
MQWYQVIPQIVKSYTIEGYFFLTSPHTNVGIIREFHVLPVEHIAFKVPYQGKRLKENTNW